MNRAIYTAIAIVIGTIFWVAADFVLKKIALDAFEKATYQITATLRSNDAEKDELLTLNKESTYQITINGRSSDIKTNKLLVIFVNYTKETAELLKNKHLKSINREMILTSWSMVFDKIKDNIKIQLDEFGKFNLITTKGKGGIDDQGNLNFDFDTIHADVLRQARMSESIGRKEYERRYEKEKSMYDYLIITVAQTQQFCALLTESAKSVEKRSIPYFIDRFNEACLEKSKEIYEWIP